MKKFLLALSLLLATPSFSQTTSTVPTVLGCTNPAPASAGQATVFIAACKTPAFLPISTTSVLGSVSKTAPVFAHTFSGYKATDLIVACPAGAVASAASCTVNGVDASALVAVSNVPSFSVTPVVHPSTGGTLSWTAPTTNTDGSPITDLASFNVYQGPDSGHMTLQSSVPAGTLTFTATGLAAGTMYYFGVSAVNSSGVESTQAVTSFLNTSGPKTPSSPSSVTFKGN